MCPPETTSASAGRGSGTSAGFSLWQGPLTLLQQHGMDVPLDVVHGQQRLPCGVSEGLCVADANQQGSGKTRPGSNRNRLDILERAASLFDGRPDHGNDVSQVLARGQFRNHAAVWRMDRDLGRNHAGKCA